MRTKMIYSSEEEHQGYGAGSGDTERYEYECPCGKGKIIETHDNIPGFRDHDVFLSCDECKTKYEFESGLPTRNWNLIEKSN